MQFKNGHEIQGEMIENENIVEDFLSHFNTDCCMGTGNGG